MKDVEALDWAGARAEADAWTDAECCRVIPRLPSLRQLVEEHAGLLSWVAALGIKQSPTKLLDVQAWWAGGRPACRGAKERAGRPCKACRRVRERPMPHCQEGLRISRQLAHHLHRAQLLKGRAAPTATPEPLRRKPLMLCVLCT